MNGKTCLIPLFFVLNLLCFHIANALPVMNQASMQRKSSLVFIENKGQVTDQDYNARNDIQFKLNAPGMDIFIGEGQIHYQWTRTIVDSTKQNTPEEKFFAPMNVEEQIQEQKFEIYRLDVKLLNAKPDAEVIKEEPQEYYENYYLPQCPDGLTAHSYQKITYKDIYPDIDWVVYIEVKSQKSKAETSRSASVLKYDFIVHAGGNPKDIQIQYNGATSLEIENGVFTAMTPFGSITENAPYTYDAATKKELSSSFVLDNNVLSFDVHANSDRTIIIDPQLEWATYYGGASNENRHNFYTGMNNSIIADNTGYIYIAGNTESVSMIATAGSHQDTIAGNQDAIIAKFSTSGILLWATYFGGTKSDWFSSIDLGNTDIYIVGGSQSKGLATPGVHQAEIDTLGWTSSSKPSDGLLAKFKTDGHLSWVSYYGGSSDDCVTDVKIRKDKLFLCGRTYSVSEISTSGAFQEKIRGYLDYFLAQFDTTGNRNWATYFGGESDEPGSPKFDIDNKGYIYMAGTTSSSNFIATPGSLHESKPLSIINSTLFLVKFDSLGNRIWGTYNSDMAYNSANRNEYADVVVDCQDNVYMAGITLGFSGVATKDAYKEHIDTGDIYDGFLIKFNSKGEKEWGTYFGGENIDNFNSVVIDKSGDLCIVGSTLSRKGIAVAGAWQPSTSDTLFSDAVFVKFDKYGNRLWATYYGGAGTDEMLGITVDSTNIVYIVGNTTSNIGIAKNALHQDILGGGIDMFLLKVNSDSIVYLEEPFNDTIICLNSSGKVIRVGYIVSRSFRVGNVFAVQLSDSNGSFASPTVIGTKTGTASGYIDCVIPKNIARAKGYRIRVVASAPFYISNDNGIDIEIRDGPEKPVASGDTALCAGSTLHLSASCTTPAVSFTWSGPGGFSAITATAERENISPADAGDYIVTVSPPECKANDTVHVRVYPSPLKPVISHNAPICEGDTLIFSYQQDTSDNTFYTWSWPNPNVVPEQNNVVDSATLAFTGEYIVVADNNGCVARDTAYIYIKPKPLLKPFSNSPVTAGKDLELTVTADSRTINYTWEGPDGFSSALQNPVIRDVTSYNSGLYTVHAEREGCKGEAATIVIINESDDDFFVLFPNPNDGSFTVKGNLLRDETLQLVVTNTVGQVIFRDKLTSSKKKINHTVALPAVANGTYFLRVRVNAKTKTIPFTVGK